MILPKLCLILIGKHTLQCCILTDVVDSVCHQELETPVLVPVLYLTCQFKSIILSVFSSGNGD